MGLPRLVPLLPGGWEGGSLVREEGALGTMVTQDRSRVEDDCPPSALVGLRLGLHVGSAHTVWCVTHVVSLPFTKHLCPQERPLTATGMWPSSARL